MPKNACQPPDRAGEMLPADLLIRAEVSFALFRQPADEPVLVLQRDGSDCLEERFADLRGTGFVLCPFAEGQGHPAVLIRGDRICRGRDAVMAAMRELAADLHGRVSTPAFAVPEVRELKARLFAARPDSGYAGALQAFLEDLRQGRFAKIVLSRAQDIPGAFSAARLFSQACEACPDAMVSLCHSRCGTWIGASPEILLQGSGGRWQTMALAGTHSAAQAAPWDAKNRREQALVADFIRGRLAPYAEDLQEGGPYEARAGSVTHLRTDFSFGLRPGREIRSLLLDLHPTPAVCGLPKEAALERILTAENLDRRYYAGFLGWWEDGRAASLYVNLRCLRLHAGGVRLYAGGGILPESTLDQEWQETCHKMCTMLALLGR